MLTLFHDTSKRFVCLCLTRNRIIPSVGTNQCNQIELFLKFLATISFTQVTQKFGECWTFLKTSKFWVKPLLLLFGQLLETIGLLFILKSGHTGTYLDADHIMKLVRWIKSPRHWLQSIYLSFERSFQVEYGSLGRHPWEHGMVDWDKKGVDLVMTLLNANVTWFGNF